MSRPPDLATCAVVSGGRVRRSADVLHRITGDRVILRRVGDLGNGMELSGSAAVIWVLLDRDSAVDDLFARLEHVGVSAQDRDAAFALLSDEHLLEPG